MIDLKELTLEEARENGIHLIDHGFGDELKKLKAIGALIAFCDESAGSFEDDDIRYGVNCIIRDIAENIETGLAHVSEEILFKLKEARHGQG